MPPTGGLPSVLAKYTLSESRVSRKSPYRDPLLSDPRRWLSCRVGLTGCVP